MLSQRHSIFHAAAKIIISTDWSNGLAASLRILSMSELKILSFVFYQFFSHTYLRTLNYNALESKAKYRAVDQRCCLNISTLTSAKLKSNQKTLLNSMQIQVPIFLELN